MVSNAMVAHNFAHNVKVNQRSGNMFWEYDLLDNSIRRIYSYGHHFCICQIDEGKKTILFTSRGYSNTTSKHIGEVWGSLITAGYICILVHNPEGSPVYNMRNYKEELQTIAEKLPKARSIYSMRRYISDSVSIKGRMEKYINYSNCQKNDFAMDEYKAGEEVYKTIEKYANSAEYKAKEEKARKAEEEKKERIRKAEEEAIKKASENISKWENGEDVVLNWYALDNNVPLRIKAKKGYYIIQTGKGVDIPMTEGKRLAEKVLNNDFAGMVVNNLYRLQYANENGVQIGCHHFTMEYLKRFAEKVLNF